MSPSLAKGGGLLGKTGLCVLRSKGTFITHVWMNVDFVLNYCGFIFLFPPFYLYSDNLESVLFAVCMCLHEPCLVWKVFKKGSEFLLHWWKFTWEDKAALESYLPCTDEEEEEEKEDWESGNRDEEIRVRVYQITEITEWVLTMTWRG